ncbi:MAG: L-seryl-tRNA(Sec) selenium transferase [Vicinamibacterales bacterium]
MRTIPSIEQLRQRPRLLALEPTYGRAAIVDALREEAAAVRADSGRAPVDVESAIESAAIERLSHSCAPSLRRVINATGVIVHTNLGRAPLARRAAARVAELSAGYTNLEYDLALGARGRRDVHAERLLRRVTGAEAAVVVNNNAAATLLVLAALAAGREVIISRGELVEIGGGFRVPDVLAQSGAVLREVGTTNRTRAADYAAAISDRTALILRVHPSNFRIEGFTERPALAELIAVARRFDLPVVEDAGSGYLSRSLPIGEGVIAGEPIISDSLAAGAAAVMFSGDKLLGGPQAGIIVGQDAPLSRIRSHPLMRALRVDKMTYAALESTLEEYAAGRAETHVPVAAMIALPLDTIERRATALAEALEKAGVQARVVDGESTIGGGSAPGTMLPTKLVAIEHRSAQEIERRLREYAVPVIARIESDRVVLDLRTVDSNDDAVLLAACSALK